MSWSVQRRDSVAVVTLTRPPENLLGFALLSELDVLLGGLSADKEVSVVVLTGGVPGYFVGHADIGDVRSLMAGEPGAGIPDHWALATERLSAIDQPVIAAVNGQAWGGGCELALAAQMRVASEDAHFRLIEVSRGAIPGAGGTQRLPRLVGLSRASRMIFSGEVVPAAEALDMGLVDAVFPAEGFLDSVLDWVQPIARQPRHSLAAAKRAVVDGLRIPLGDGLAYEQRLFRSVMHSPESRALRPEHD
jgi:enoyl-CoA hydratase/carnithine racemase